MEVICERLSLTDLEQEEIHVDLSSVEEVISRGNDCLLVELLTKRYYNCEAFKRTMKKIWLPVKAMRFRELETEILMAEFENIKHKE